MADYRISRVLLPIVAAARRLTGAVDALLNKIAADISPRRNDCAKRPQAFVKLGSFLGASVRILTFLHSFEPGGVERVALRLVRQWRAMGIDAPLFMGRDRGALRAELAEDLAFRTPAPRRWSAPLETLWMIWTLPEVIRTTEPDVLFCAGNTYTIVVLAMKLMLGGRCPPVVAKVSNELLRPGQGMLARTLYCGWAWLQSKFVDTWVVMHPDMRADVAALCGPTPIAVIPDPALTLAQIEELRKWRPRERPGDGRRFVALGRLVPQKNYSMLLRAFAAGAASDDRLTIYGDGEERDKLEAMTAELGMSGRLQFAGHVAHSASCLIGQDALLMTSHYEGVPATLVEGMTCGMPCIATECGIGVRALVDDYEAGTLVANGDVDAFARSIATMVVGTAQPAPFDAEQYTIEAGAGDYLEAFRKVRRGVPSPAILAQRTDRLEGLLEGDLAVRRRIQTEQGGRD